MRAEPAPQPQLSLNGAELATTYGKALWLPDRPVALEHGASTSALSPDGRSCAVAGDGRVSVLTHAAGEWAVSASAAAPMGVLHLALTEHVVVATMRTGDGDAALWVWRPDLGRTATIELPAPPAGLRLDAGRAEALVWGPGFARVYALEADGLAPAWDAPPLDFAPFGYLMPVLGGGIAAYERGRLELLRPERRTWALDGAELAAVSPDEGRVAWLWGRGAEGARARTLALEDGTAGPELELGELGAFVALAVGDDGTVTVATSFAPDGVRLFRGLPDGTVTGVERNLGGAMRGQA